MKYMKMLGLAAIAAAALMAFVGASTASATVLCKTNASPCPEHYPSGTTVEATLKSGTSALLEAGFANITCTSSTVTGKTSNTGGANETVKGAISTLSFSNCNATVTTIKNGELEIHATGKGNGSLVGKGSEVTVAIGSTSCVYGTSTGTTLGTLTGGTPATMNVKASLTRISGGFLCASPATWTATYTVTKPTTLFVI
jgi:hypothetical protein